MWSNSHHNQFVLRCVALAGVVFCVQRHLETASCAEATKSNLTSVSTVPDRRFAEKVALFGSLECDAGDRVYRYRLFVPRRIEADKAYPLLVWLHGLGESGDDNWRQLFYIQDEVMCWEDRPGGFPCFVLAPQCPYEGSWNEKMLAVVRELMRRTVADWPIDEKRIYAGGVSSGGGATWRLGASQPGTFAALFPMASRGAKDSAIRSLSKIPIWAFHSAVDPGQSPDGIRATVAALQVHGGPSWLTETAGNQHDCWTEASREYHVTEWLLHQRLGAPEVPPPAWARWKSFRNRYLPWDRIFPTTVFIGAVVVLIAVVTRHLRLCKSDARSRAPRFGHRRTSSRRSQHRLLRWIGALRWRG